MSDALLGLPTLEPWQAAHVQAALSIAAQVVHRGRELLGAPPACNHVALPDEVACEQWSLALDGVETRLRELVRLAGTGA